MIPIPQHLRLGILLAALSPIGVVTGENAAIDLSGPEAYKLSWDVRSLRVADLNNNGLPDLTVINNARSRIDFLIQQPEDGEPEPFLRGVRPDRWEPVLDDTRFRRESLGITGTAYSLVVADLNNNGLMDISYSGADPALSIRYQLEDGGFGEPKTYNRFSAVPWDRSIVSLDLESNGKTDLLVVARGEILLFRQGSNGLNLDPDVLPLTDDAYALTVTDLTQNGRKDILYVVDAPVYPLRLRLQNEDGQFGPEYAFDVRISRANFHALPEWKDQTTVPVFAYLESRTHHLKTMKLVPTEDEVDSLLQIQPRIYPVQRGEGRASYAIGRFDQKNNLAVVAAHPSSSNLAVYQKKPGGDFLPPVLFPSLTGITEIAVFPKDSDGKDALIVFSQSENFIGITQMTEQGRFDFPRPLPNEGEPVAFTAGVFGDKSDFTHILLLTREGRDYSWQILARREDGSAGFEVVEKHPLEDVRRPPESILLADLNGNGSQEWILLTPREPARIFSYDSDEGITELAVQSSIRRSLLSDLNRSRINVGDPVGDGRERLLVAGTGFVRSIFLDESGELVVEDQFNSRSSSDRIAAPLFTDLDGDGQPDLLLYETREGALQLLRRDEDGVYRYSESKKTGPIQIANLPYVISDDDDPGILFWGNDRFWHIPFQESGWTVESLDTYETDLRNVQYSLFAPGHLRQSDLYDFVVIDGSRNIMEIVGVQEDKSWKSLLHFPVFDRNTHYQGRSGSSHEPREIILSDITGTGLDDILLLVHDRLLLYPNENR